VLTVQECIDFSELTNDEAQALAAHEQIPEVVAAELGQCLLNSDVGTWLLKRYLREQRDAASRRNKLDRCAKLTEVLNGFSAAHPTYALSRKPAPPALYDLRRC
jgi:hypothetical protein